MVDRVTSVFVQVLNVPADAVDDSMAFNESKQWDSVAHINLMLALEEEFGISITDDEIVELTNVAAIRRFLADRGALAPDGAA